MIVIATRDELELVRNAREPVIITGVGALNIITTLRDFPRSTPIHNVGYAGSNKLPIGARCRIGKVKAYHPSACFEDREYVLDGSIPCYTAGDFVTSADIDEPCVFDMELAYILALGFYNVTAEKIVSDNLSMEEYEECLRK